MRPRPPRPQAPPGGPGCDPGAPQRQEHAQPPGPHGPYGGGLGLGGLLGEARPGAAGEAYARRHGPGGGDRPPGAPLLVCPLPHLPGQDLRRRHAQGPLPLLPRAHRFPAPPLKPAQRRRGRCPGVLGRPGAGQQRLPDRDHPGGDRQRGYVRHGRVMVSEGPPQVCTPGALRRQPGRFVDHPGALPEPADPGDAGGPAQAQSRHPPLAPQQGPCGEGSAGEGGDRPGLGAT
mmetsp:Transcript_21746/g.68248  ORF Transcript_21746/g.68248 Transcript_21746/m.68248 type:complete len:232 (+) Transcript_21746:310-1005(+)